MKHLLLISSIFLSATSLKAQDCHYDSDKADPITGKSTKLISCKLAKSWKINFMNQEEKLTLGLFMILPGDQTLKISKGDSLIMRLENNEIITLFAAGNAGPTSFVAGSGSYAQVMSSYIPTYECDAESMKKMSKSPIAAMRIFYGTTPVTLQDIKGKSAERIMNAASCIGS